MAENACVLKMGGGWEGGRKSNKELSVGKKRLFSRRWGGRGPI